MKKTSCILLVFAAAMMLFGFGCASADIADGLVYDETDNTWAAGDEDLTELAGIMKRECTKSPLIKVFIQQHRLYAAGNDHRKSHGKKLRGLRTEKHF